MNLSFPGSGSVYSVTIKPSTRSARSIAVSSVLKLWRPGGHREPLIWLRPTAALGSCPTFPSRLAHPHALCRRACDFELNEGAQFSKTRAGFLAAIGMTRRRIASTHGLSPRCAQLDLTAREA